MFAITPSGCFVQSYKEKNYLDDCKNYFIARRVLILYLFFHRPPELASKYANFSEGVCKPGYASALMTVIFPK